MDNYFDSEITNLEKEITRLKTTGAKSAVVVNTTAQTVPISMRLTLGTASSPPGAVAQRYYEIETDKDAITMITLDHYYDNITTAWEVLPNVRNRFFDLSRFVFGNGNIGVRIIAYGTNIGADNDADKISAGQSVTMTCNLTIRCTTDFTVREL